MKRHQIKQAAATHTLASFGLRKLALSPGQIGGLVGAGVGGLGGYMSDPDAEAQERLLRTLGGAGLGGAVGYLGARHYYDAHPTDRVERNISEANAAAARLQREAAITDATRVVPPAPRRPRQVDPMADEFKDMDSLQAALRDKNTLWVF